MTSSSSAPDCVRHWEWPRRDCGRLASPRCFPTRSDTVAAQGGMAATLGNMGDGDDENWLKHTMCWLDDSGNARLDFRPVHLQPLSNEVATIPPRERVY
jgi:hypothetical protein